VLKARFLHQLKLLRKGTLFSDNRHGAYRRRRGPAPFNRQYAEDKGVEWRGYLVQVAHILQVVIFALQHDRAAYNHS
jgi:hypothetical protein